MKVNQRLIIFVSDYPQGHGEPFFHDELSVLSHQFDSIIVIRKIINEKNTFTFEINNLQNVTFINLLRDKDFGFVEMFKFCQIIGSSIFKEFYKLNTLKRIKYYLSFIYKSIQFYNSINKTIKITKDDIVYTYWLDELTYSLLLLKDELNGKLNVISRCHGWDVYEFRNELNYLPMRSIIYSKLDLLCTISENAKKYIIEKYQKIKLFNVDVFRLGVLDRLKENKVENQIEGFKNESDSISILSFSTFSKVKRIELLIESLSLIKTLNIKWYHIGNGLFENKYESDIYDLINQKLLIKSNVEVNLMGFLNSTEIGFFLNNTSIDLMINTSQYEGVPVTIMEAMSFSIPVIAPNVGGINEIVNDSNGFLLDANINKNDVSDAILKFSKLSKNAINNLRKNARQTFLVNFDSKNNFLSFSNRIMSLKSMEYIECSKCLYNNQVYPSIIFDKNVVCDVCHNYDKLSNRKVFQHEKGEQFLNGILKEVKRKGQNKKYDCALGVSGGVDSSYLMIKMKEWGLNPLIIHVDNGWNSELAVANIENLVQKLGFDLFTHVLDWSEMRDVQLAFLKSSVIDIDIPFDSACLKKLLELVNKYNIKYLFSGHNTVTEGWMPDSFLHYKLDSLNVFDIQRKFGTIKLKQLSFLGPINLFYYQKIKRIKFITPLDYIKYDKNEVLNFLEKEYDWRPYGNKHYENIYTRFYQGYILPTKFKIDKRISHLSTLICSGQLTKEEAKHEINKEIYNPNLLIEDRAFFIKKLNLTETEFNDIMSLPIKRHTDYKSYINLYNKIGFFKKIIKLVVGKNEL